MACSGDARAGRGPAPRTRPSRPSGGPPLLVREPHGLRGHLPDDAGGQKRGGDAATRRGGGACAPGAAAVRGLGAPRCPAPVRPHLTFPGPLLTVLPRVRSFARGCAQTCTHTQACTHKHVHTLTSVHTRKHALFCLTTPEAASLHPHLTDQPARQGPLLSPRGSPGGLLGSEGLLQYGELRPAVEGTPGTGAQKTG